MSSTINSKPDFLIVGAAKAGTTYLFNRLNEHPEVYIPKIKECRFFSQLPKNFKGLGAEFFTNEGITNPQEYFDLFKHKEKYLCGDISNDYLYYYDRTIENIKKYLSVNVKIVIILRNPVERAYSNYMHHVRDGWENLSFEKALEAEKDRIKNNWGWSYHYFKAGLYYEQVKAYLDNFEKVKIILYDDLKNEKTINELFKFLNLDTIKKDTSINKYNVSGKPRSKFIHNILTKNNRILRTIARILRPITSNKIKSYFYDIQQKLIHKNLIKEPLREDMRQQTNQLYLSDISNLEKLINRDLDKWRV